MEFEPPGDDNAVSLLSAVFPFTPGPRAADSCLREFEWLFVATLKLPTALGAPITVVAVVLVRYGGAPSMLLLFAEPVVVLVVAVVVGLELAFFDCCCINAELLVFVDIVDVIILAFVLASSLTVSKRALFVSLASPASVGTPLDLPPDL